MIVGRDAGLLQLTSFLITELSEGNADLHAEFADFANRFEHGVESAVAGFHSFPCGSHTETGGATFACFPGQGKDIVTSHELPGLDPGIVTCALCAVGAILAAPPGFHAQQSAELDCILVPVLELNRAGTLDEIKKRAAVDILKLGEGDGLIAHGG